MQQSVDLKFIGGINEDVNPLSIDESSFYNARNFDNLNSDGSNFGNEVNVNGNRLLLTIPDIPADGIKPAQNDLKILNYKVFDDWIVIFTTNNEDYNPLGSYGQIWLVKVSLADYTVIGNMSNALIYNGILNFSLYNKISSIEISYKNDSEMYVYWTDGYSNLRGCNVFDTNLHTFSPDKLELLSNIELSKPYVSKIYDNGGYLPASSIQYCYKLKRDSFVTAFSPLSNLYPIYESSTSTYTSNKTMGSQVGEDTNKSVDVRVDITGENEFYNEIEIYRVTNLFYNDPPTIDLIYNGLISNDGITVLDSGSVSFGTTTSLELNTIYDKLFTTRWITSTSNTLFAANTKNSYLDVSYDSRAYRFNKNSYSSRVYEYEGDSTYVNTYNSVTSEWYNFEDDADVVDYFQSPTTTSPWRYRMNSNTVGGDGPNVGYEIITQQRVIDSRLDHSNEVYTAPQSGGHEAETSMVIKNYLRGETYRFGIVFINNQGVSSFVNWIADIYISQVDDALTTVNTVTNEITANYVGIKFFIKNIPIDPITGDYYKFRIVRVNRDEDNRTVLDQCIAGTTYYDSGSSKWAQFRDLTPHNPSYTYTFNQQMIAFYSPNISYFQLPDKISYNGTKVIKVRTVSPTGSPLSYTSNDNQFPGGVLVKSRKYGESDSPYTGPSYMYDVDDSAYTPTSSTRSVGPYIYHNFDTTIGTPSSPKSVPYNTGMSSVVLYMPSKINSWGIDITTVNIIKENIRQYGGNTFSERSYNSYISASEPITPNHSTESVESFSGDTFITMFQLPYVMNTFKSDTDGVLNIYTVPIESSVNTDLNSSAKPLNYHSIIGGMYRGGYQEKAGVYKFPDDETYSQAEDAFVYNSSYSKNDSVVVYIAKPFNYNEGTTKNLIRYSEVSNASSSIDGWRDFKTNNYQEVDNITSGITSIHKWNDNVLFFQKNAFGICKVNERVTQQSINDISIVLGTGDKLGKPIYKSRLNGTIHGESVSLTSTSVLFYDVMNKGIMMYQIAYTGATTVGLSLVTGINKTITNNFDNKIRYTSKLLNSGAVSFPPIVGENPRLHVGVNSITLMDDIYFSLFDIESINTSTGIFEEIQVKDTVKFNTTLKKFNSYFDFSSPVYEKFNDSLTSLHPTDLNSIWIFDKSAEYGSYYGTKYPSEITFIINGKNKANKIFTNIEYTADITDDSGDDVRNETFDRAQVWNEHQDTGVFSLINMKNLRRRLRRWHITIPRALQLRTGDRKDARVRSRYIYARLIYDNLTNKKINLSDIRFKYLVSQEEKHK